jgi:propionyl-CoA carboxylase alpha chain
MIEAIDNYEIAGFATTLGFCKFAVDHPEFRNGNFTINFVGDHYKTEMLRKEIDENLAEKTYQLFRKLKNDQEPVYEDQHLSSWLSRK